MRRLSSLVAGCCLAALLAGHVVAQEPPVLLAQGQVQKPAPAQAGGAASQRSGAKVYKGDVAPPEIPEVRFKRITMRGSRNVRVGQPVAAQVFTDDTGDIQRSSDTAFFYSHQTKSGSKTTYVRMCLKSKNAQMKIEGATLVVQYFARSIQSGGSGSQPVATNVIALPALDDVPVWVDCPPVSIAMSKSRTDYGFGRTLMSKSGSEFYGLVASVFSSDKALLYQELSQASLAKLAAVAVP